MQCVLLLSKLPCTFMYTDSSLFCCLFSEKSIEYAYFQILQLRFPSDQRVGVARKFLQSFSPVRIALTQKPEVRYNH